MSEIAIRAENLGKSYPLKRGRSTDLREMLNARLRFQPSAAEIAFNEGQFWALKHLSFELKHGEVVSLTGHNGAGKTTLLRILSGVTDPTEGRVDIHGRTSSLLEIGAGFHSQLTGRENVYVHAAVLGMRKWEIDRQFDAIVDYAGLDSFIDSPIKRWSRGMCVRLAFSIAAHVSSDILLVDDLFDAVDADFRNRCLEKIVHSAVCGRLVIFVSHDESFVEETSTRVLHFERGQLVSDRRNSAVRLPGPLGTVASV
jgi:lipopolysaccharide transport system ATP-binding protein